MKSLPICNQAYDDRVNTFVAKLEELKNTQEVKADAGKPKLTLVPRQIIYDIAQVREYGVQKYGDPDNWKKVEVERYRDAAFRHFMSYLNDPHGKDEESGIEHLKHLACNIAFLCELERKEKPICGFANVAEESLSQNK